MIKELLETSIDGTMTYIRNDKMPIMAQNQQMELERIIHLLTGETFVYNEIGKKYHRYLKNPQNFKILKSFDHGNTTLPTNSLNCICGENTCTSLFQTKHIPTDICFGIGSVCLERFDKNNSKDIYHLVKRSKCLDCNCRLVFKSSSKYKKNTNKYLNGRCDDCHCEYIVSNRSNGALYLDVKYNDKDYAKSLGALWCPSMKCWKIYYDNKNRDKLLDLYGLKKFENNYKEDDSSSEEDFEVHFDTKTYINVSYNQKDEAKKLGALWDVEKKCWYFWFSNPNRNKLINTYGRK